MNDRGYWKDRYKTVRDVRVVGHRSWSVADNERHYAALQKQFRVALDKDLPRVHRESVLELGYGLGHYARVCRDGGFRSYFGVDFAAPPGPDLAPVRFEYRQQDVGVAFDLGRRFDLVTAIDVLYHVTDEARFEVALDNIVRHASRFVYVTGLFRDVRPAPHVVHRPLARFSKLGVVIEVKPWRDTMLARFKVRPARTA